MPSKPTPEIIQGRKNCVRCGRWRYLATDFSVRLYHKKAGPVEQTINTCNICCNRAAKRVYHDLSYEERKARWTKQNLVRQSKIDLAKEAKAARRELIGYKNGRLVSAIPFRMWLVKKLKVYGSIEALHIATGLGHEQVNRYVRGYEWNESLTCDPRPIVTVPVSVVDKALTNEGSDSLRGIGYD